MKDLNISWPPRNTCKMKCASLKELREDSMEIEVKDGGKNYTREDKGTDR